MQIKTVTRYFLNLFLAPWIFLWGLYSIYWIGLLAFRQNKSSSITELAAFDALNIDLLIRDLFLYSFGFAVLSYTFAFYLRLQYPKIMGLVCSINVLIVIFLLIIQWPLIASLSPF
jgi:hypothetical protein